MNSQADKNQNYRNEFINKHLMWYVKKYIFFYKQSVYKQLALGWQIGKQLLGLNPFSLSNKNLQIKEKWSFSFVLNVKQL